jgi:hypothetical protein
MLVLKIPEFVPAGDEITYVVRETLAHFGDHAALVGTTQVCLPVPELHTSSTSSRATRAGSQVRPRPTRPRQGASLAALSDFLDESNRRYKPLSRGPRLLPTAEVPLGAPVR